MLSLSLSELTFWIALMEVLLVVGLKIVIPYNTSGQFLLDKKRFQFATIAVGIAFVVTFSLQLVFP